MRSITTALLAFPLLAALTGCAMTATQANLADLPITTSGMHGTVYGGQQAVTGSTITLYAVGTSGYGQGATSLAATTSDSKGNWNIATYTCPYANTPTYLIASGGIAGTTNNANIALLAGTGPCSGLTNLNVTINEISTAAGAYAMSHFFPTTVGGAVATDLIGGTAAGSGVYQPGLVMADNQTVNVLTNLGAGTSALTTTAAGVTTTLESAKLNTIANILAACVNSNGQTSITETSTYCGQLFAATQPTGSTARPLDTLQAAVQMALHPYQNVTTLYNLPPATSPFVGLAAMPNDWTLGVSYTSSAFGLSIAGSSTSGSSTNIDIDIAGNIWFPTDTSAAHGTGYFSPATATFNGPYATALFVPQYIAIDTAGTVWATDLDALQAVGVQATSPATTTAYTYGGAGSGSVGVIAIGLSAASGQGLVATVNGTYLYSEAGGAVTNSPAAVPQPASGIIAISSESTGAKAYSVNSGSATPCTLSLDQTGANPTTYATTTANCISGGISYTTASADVVMAAASLNQLCNLNSATCFASPSPVSMPEGIATDGDGALWIANSGNASVTTMGYTHINGTAADYTKTATVAYIHNATYGNTLKIPYGLAIDNAGNVWVSNAGCVNTTATACTPGAFTLSEIIGAAAPTRTPLSNQVLNSTVGTRP